MMKKILAIGLVITMILGISMVSYAADEQEVNESFQQRAVELLAEGWKDYYTFEDYTATLCGRHTNNGVTEEVFLLEITAILKADSVEELDYYKGVKSCYDNLMMGSSQLTTGSMNNDMVLQYEQYQDIMTNEVEKIYDNLEQYIGEEQVFPFYVKAIYDENDISTVTFLFDNGIEYASVETTFPESSNTLMQIGYENMSNTGTKLETALASDMSTAQSEAVSYSIYNAVVYMETYTSNPTSCNVCGSGCSALVDTTKYNTAYPNYVVKNVQHRDCANFVSQALCAGGIPTDSTWKSGATAWINVAALCSHMVDEGYWEQITYSSLAVGDFIRFTGSDSHIVMVTAHDGVNFRYSGHTNDKKNYQISLSSNTKNVEYYSIK